MIRLEEVHKRYVDRGFSVDALVGINLSIERGELVAVMGPSGSGKTTLLNIMGTLDRPTSGRVVVAGEDVTSASERYLSKFRLFNIGFVFQSINLVGSLSALDNVALPLLLAGVRRRDAYRVARVLLRLVGLEGLEDRKPAQLSGGQQQRVAIARALANMPSVVLLDEPTSNVDAVNTLVILELLKYINKVFGVTMVIATHDPEVASIASRVVYLRGGRVVGEYTRISDIVERPKIDVDRIRGLYEEYLEAVKSVRLEVRRREALKRIY